MTDYERGFRDAWNRNDRISPAMIRAIPTRPAAPSAPAELSKRIDDALEKSKPLVREALRIGRSISGADPTLAGVVIGAPSPTVPAAVMDIAPEGTTNELPACAHGHAADCSIHTTGRDAGECDCGAGKGRT